MLLQPRKVKHRKWQRGSLKGIEHRVTELDFGSYGLKSLGRGWMTARQIEAARRAIIRYLKKGGKLWIRVFPDKPITSKGIEVGMGGGKGAVDHYVIPIKPGRIIFELDGLDEATAREAFRRAADKLSLKMKFVKREL